MPAEPQAAGRPARTGRERTGALLVCLALGALIGLAGRGLPEILASQAAYLGLDMLGAGAFLSGVAFGWPGALGFWAGDSAMLFLLTGRAPRPLLLLPILLLGVGGFLAFRLVARVDRRLPDLRSYFALLGSVTLAAFPASILLVNFLFPGFSWSAALVWQTAIVSSTMLFAPAILVLCPERIWRWRAPIAKEEARRRSSATASEGVHTESSSGISLRRPSRRVADALMVIAVVALIHFVVVATGPSAPFNHWLFLLYSLPILFAAYRGGLRAGILAGTLVGLSLLLSTRPGQADLGSHLSAVERQGGLLLFSLFGAIAGSTRDRERNLTRQLERSNRALRRDLERVLAALRSAMEAKDQYTEGHLRRVCEFAVEVGRRLKLLPHELELLEIASLLHDVGKIGIADSVLRKDGPLDPREREVMQRHPAIGARILENIEGLKEAADMVRHHQERFDGSTDGDFPGYPDGLAGRAIPLGARIIAVVDAFDAMTSDRPYRDSIGFERAIEVLRQESGHQFDPRVVDTFLALLDEREWYAQPAPEAERAASA